MNEGQWVKFNLAPIEVHDADNIRIIQEAVYYLDPKGILIKCSKATDDLLILLHTLSMRNK